MPKRFTLSTLLLVMLLVSLVFGYAQWRKQRLMAEVATLREIGVSGLVLTNSWFWPNVSSDFSVVLRVNGVTSIEDKAELRRLESTGYHQNVKARLRRIGVEQVYYVLLDERGKFIKWRMAGY